MRLVIQRVSNARVTSADEIVGQIGPGLCVFLGIGKADDKSKGGLLAEKMGNLRIFEDDQGKMNRSVRDVGAEILVVSQFTLYGDCTRGNRPSFSDAAPAAEERELRDISVAQLKALGPRVSPG